MKTTAAQRRQLHAIDNQLSGLEIQIARGFDLLHEADEIREDIRFRLHRLVEALPSDFAAVSS